MKEQEILARKLGREQAQELLKFFEESIESSARQLQGLEKESFLTTVRKRFASEAAGESEAATESKPFVTFSTKSESQAKRMLQQVIPFGKYAGSTWETVSPQYLEWYAGTCKEFLAFYYAPCVQSHVERLLDQEAGSD